MDGHIAGSELFILGQSVPIDSDHGYSFFGTTTADSFMVVLQETILPDTPLTLDV